QPLPHPRPRPPRCHLPGWQLFKTALVFHHAGEDADLWPRMRHHLADRPDDLALLQAMENEHARINPLLDAVDGPLADTADGHERPGDAADTLVTELSGHLAEAERDPSPWLTGTLPQAEWQGFGADQRRTSGIHGARSCSRGCSRRPRPSRHRPSLLGSPHRCGSPTARSGSPATPAKRTGSRA